MADATVAIIRIADLAPMRDLIEALAAFVGALPTAEGARGVEWFDSYRGHYCPTCWPGRDPVRTEGVSYRHADDCPLAVLLATAERISGGSADADAT